MKREMKRHRPSASAISASPRTASSVDEAFEFNMQSFGDNENFDFDERVSLHIFRLSYYTYDSTCKIQSIIFRWIHLDVVTMTLWK